MASVVFDASAVLALLRDEPGAAKFDATDPMATDDFTWIWDVLG